MMKTYAVTGARGTTPEQNETIRNAVKAHAGGTWHIGDATGADARATEQAQEQGDTVTTYYVDKGLARAGYAVRSMRMIDGAMRPLGAVAEGNIAQGATKLLAFPNKPCPTATGEQIDKARLYAGGQRDQVAAPTNPGIALYPYLSLQTTLPHGVTTNSNPLLHEFHSSQTLLVKRKFIAI